MSGVLPAEIIKAIILSYLLYYIFKFMFNPYVKFQRANSLHISIKCKHKVSNIA